MVLYIGAKFCNMRLFLFLSLISLSINVFGQSNPDTLFSGFEDITISANRIDIPFSDISRSITIITAEQIASTGFSSINEVLQTVAGVDIRQRGANGVQADLSIRGGTFEQSLILLNGVRMTDPQTGHHMMNIPVDILDIERIEVIKGPAARVYGQNAFAGAVNIVTKKADKFGVTIQSEIGQHNRQDFYGQIALPINNYHQSLSVSHRSSDGYRFNSDYNILNLLYQSSLPVAKGDISLTAGYVDRDFGANGFYGSEQLMDQYETIQTSFISVASTQRINKLKIVPRLSYRRNSDNWQFLRHDPEVFQNFHTSQVLTAEVHNSLLHRLGTLGFGVEYNYIHLNSDNLIDGSTGSGIHVRQQVGFHLENRFLLANEKIDITPGILILGVSDGDVSYFPGLDLGYNISGPFKAFANLGWTSRIPTFTDLFYQDPRNEGNPNLTEENAFTYEFGLKYNSRNIQTSVSYFDRSATDQIDWFKENGLEEEKWRPDNFNSATYKGLELSLTGRIPSVPILEYITVGYTYIDATFEETEFAFSRNQLENLRHQFVINPGFALGPINLNMTAKINDRVSLENYHTIDARVSYTYKAFTFSVRGTNLTDQIYRESNLVELPGRWMMGGIRWSL